MSTRHQLNISIFYNRQGWPGLLKHCINPCLIQFSQSGWMENFLLFLEGDSIRMTLFTDPLKIQLLTQEFDKAVQDYITGNPYGDNDRLEFNVMPAHEYSPVQEVISKNIATVFQEETAGNDMLFTFFIYHALAYIHQQNSTLESALYAIENLIDKQQSGGDEAQWDFMLDRNGETLREIVADIWEGKTRTELDWLIDWEQALDASPFEGAFDMGFDALWALIFQHLGLQFNEGVKQSLLRAIYKTFLHFQKPVAIKRSPRLVTVILTIWKRDHIEEQLELLSQQTHQPSAIWIYQCGPYRPPPYTLVKKYKHISYQLNTQNLGYFGRFTLALHVDTPYTLIMDDDVVPSSNWIESSMDLCATNNSVIASSGRIVPPHDYNPEIVKSESYLQQYFKGDADNNRHANSCEENTRVDFGCNSWFFKAEWINHFWSVRPCTFDTGEDIHLSASCMRRGKIETICPAQNADAVCGNLKKHYGFDEMSSWKHPEFHKKRERVLRYWIDELGWKPLNWR